MREATDELVPSEPNDNCLNERDREEARLIEPEAPTPLRVSAMGLLVELLDFVFKRASIRLENFVEPAGCVLVVEDISGV